MDRKYIRALSVGVGVPTCRASTLAASLFGDRLSGANASDVMTDESRFFRRDPSNGGGIEGNGTDGVGTCRDLMGLPQSVSGSDLRIPIRESNESVLLSGAGSLSMLSLDACLIRGPP